MDGTSGEINLNVRKNKGYKIARRERGRKENETIKKIRNSGNGNKGN